MITTNIKLNNSIFYNDIEGNFIEEYCHVERKYIACIVRDLSSSICYTQVSLIFTLISHVSL